MAIPVVGTISAYAILLSVDGQSFVIPVRRLNIYLRHPVIISLEDLAINR